MGWFKRSAPKKPEPAADAETLVLLAKTQMAVDRLEKTAERLDKLVADLGQYVTPEEPRA